MRTVQMTLGTVIKEIAHMIVCEFCQHYQKAACRLGLNIPKAMSCREFSPSMEQFCSNPKDFVDPSQIIEMARFFGFQRTELKKITLMAAEEEKLRAAPHSLVGEALGLGKQRERQLFEE